MASLVYLRSTCSQLHTYSTGRGEHVTDTCKKTRFLGMAHKWNSLESVPVLKLVPLRGKVLAEAGMQMADKFKNQCVVNRLFAKYTDTPPADGRQVQEPVCSQQALCQVYGHTACRCQRHPQKLSTVSCIWDLEHYRLSEIVIWLFDQKYETYCFIHVGILCNFVKHFVFFNVVKPCRRIL